MCLLAMLTSILSHHRQKFIEIQDSGEFLDLLGIFNLGVVRRPTEEVNVSGEPFFVNR